MTLTEIGRKYGTDKATYHGFTDFYEDEFRARQFVPQTILEIGIKDGASLLMWREFFPGATIWGFDISPVIPHINNIRTIAEDALGDGVAGSYFTNVKFDLIIDDGSHMTADQQKALNIYWSYLAPGGIFIMEDLHSSFLKDYINTKITTYDYLRSNRFFEGQYKIFQKDPNILHDSVTSMIFK